VIDHQFRDNLWLESGRHPRALISSAIYCDGAIGDYSSDDEEIEREHHHSAPPDAAVLDAVPRDATTCLPIMPPVAQLFKALGAPSMLSVLRRGGLKIPPSIPDASRVLAILHAHPRMDLSQAYSFMWGPRANFLSFALEMDNADAVFALVSSGRAPVDDFRNRYVRSYADHIGMLYENPTAASSSRRTAPPSASSATSRHAAALRAGARTFSVFSRAFDGS
jgi:hypothetical protein